MLLDIIHSDYSAEIKKQFLSEWVKRNLESYQMDQLREQTIKALKRNTFGMPKFENFKARIMLLN